MLSRPHARHSREDPRKGIAHKPELEEMIGSAIYVRAGIQHDNGGLFRRHYRGQRRALDAGKPAHDMNMPQATVAPECPAQHSISRPRLPLQAGRPPEWMRFFCASRMSDGFSFMCTTSSA